jgi:hypothetical protein
MNELVVVMMAKLSVSIPHIIFQNIEFRNSSGESFHRPVYRIHHE